MIASGYIPASVFDRAPSPERARAIWDGVEVMPAAFRGAVLGRFEERAAQGSASAIAYLEDAARELSGSAVSLSSSDSEICDYARERAEEVRSLLMATVSTSTDGILLLLRGYCKEFGAVAPPKVKLAGLVARMTDGGWWRRQVRKSLARRVEAHAIELGFVHRRAGLYASEEAVRRNGEQRARNRAALEATEATNEEGLTMTLAQLSEVGVSNPRIRRGELMTRIAGFEGFARAAGHVGMFYTATAPSRMHPRFAATGDENPKFDGTKPRECASYLSKTWAKARAWLHRRGINIYGFRVAEPHHDGTPHWHMLFFMLPQVVESVTACFRRYFCEADAHELATEKAAGARFNAKVIDWKRGSAAGYISKYIAKNIDGVRNDGESVGEDFEADEQTKADETAPRVLAWASTWGIRQFQQIGGPGVTVWRELRRLREMEHQGDLFDTWSAADAGNWEEFTRRQGGVEIARADRPVQLWKEDAGQVTKYGEDAGAVVKGVRLGDEVVITRVHTWEIKSKPASLGEGADSGRIAGRRGGFAFGFQPGAAGPWSPVNNCTRSKDADGFEIGSFADSLPVPELSPAEVAKIKAAEVAAVVAYIASRRKRGGFGQFPTLGAVKNGSS